MIQTRHCRGPCRRTLTLDQFATPRMRICKACYGRMTVERIHEASEVRRDKWNAYQREYARKRRRPNHAPDPQT